MESSRPSSLQREDRGEESEEEGCRVIADGDSSR